MLDLMRRHAKSWIINVLIGAIVLVFVFWGAGSFRNRKTQFVAEINGDPVMFFEYQEVYRNMLEQARERYRQIWSDDFAASLNLKQKALDNIINERLLFNRAQSLKIKVTEIEIRNNILATSYFQVDQRFNMGRYQSFLSRNQLSIEKYENFIRRDLTIKKLNAFILGFTKVSEADIRDYFHLNNDRVNLEFVLFKNEDFNKSVKYTEDELKKFFEKNKENYKIEPKVKVVYMVIKPKELEASIEVTENDLLDQYEFDLEKYREPEKVRARHILFKMDETATASVEARVRVDALKVLEKAKAAEDFIELAKKYSEGPTAASGGDLGWFTRNDMVAPFAEKAFSMKEGDVSDLVRTRFGFHIIKVEARQKEGRRPFEEVRDQIEDELRIQLAQEHAADLAVEIYERASLTQDFEAVAKEYNLTPVVTDFFTTDEAIEDIGLRRKFTLIAHSLDPGEIGPLVDLPDGHYIIKSLEVQDARLPSFEEAVELVKLDITEEKARELARQQAVAFLKEVAGGLDWAETAKKYKAPVEETGEFTRMGSIPKIGILEEIVEDAFVMTKVGQVGKRAYQGVYGYYAIRLKQTLVSSEEELEKQKENVTQRIMAEKSRRVMDQWLEAIKAASTITVDESMI